MIRRFFKQDNMILGIVLGLIIPAAIYGLLHVFTQYVLSSGPDGMPIIKTSTLRLIAIFINLITLRYYLLRLKFDATGRGILLSTMILAIIYFAIYL